MSKTDESITRLRHWVALGELREWVAEHRPDLADKLGPLPLAEGLQILNAETGLQISADAPIEHTAPQILAALKQQHDNKGNHEST